MKLTRQAVINRRKQAQRHKSNSGVIARNIVDGGELSKIGIVDNYIIMEINGKPVNSQKDIENLLKNYKGIF